MIRLVIVLSFISILAHAEPKWFSQEELLPMHENYYIGYGWGKNIQEAKAMARNGIAKQIDIKIESEDAFRYNNKGVSDFTSISKQVSKINLKSLDKIRLEHVNKIYYIALGYENLTFEQRFSKMLKKKKCRSERQHPYLRETEVFKTINKLTSCTYDINIGRKGNNLGLYYDDVFLRIPREKNYEFYVSTYNETILLKPSSNNLREGDNFKVYMESNTNGYVSLFDVYANGIVTVMEENIAVNSSEPSLYPSKESEVVLYASTLDGEKETYDLYVAIFSKRKLKLDSFVKSKDEIETEFVSKKLENLLHLMNENNFTTSLIKIRK